MMSQVNIQSTLDIYVHMVLIVPISLLLCPEEGATTIRMEDPINRNQHQKP